MAASSDLPPEILCHVSVSLSQQLSQPGAPDPAAELRRDGGAAAALLLPEAEFATKKGQNAP